MDHDVVNLIHYLRWEVENDPSKTSEFLFSRVDTPVDAAPYLDGGQLPSALRQFVLAVDAQLKDPPKNDFMFGFPLSERPRSPGQLRLCFVAMPYRPDWFESVKRTILEADGQTAFSCIVSGDMATPGSIINQVWQEIRKSEAIVADLTGENPNVYYELGLAHALGKPAIVLTQSKGDLPFDIAPLRRITYDKAKLGELQTALQRAFESVPRRYRFDPDPQRSGSAA